MTHRPASWRVPTSKQMEKLAAEAARRSGPAAADPDAPLPAESWESVLKDPHAGATVARMPSDVFRKSRATYCVCPAAADRNSEEDDLPTSVVMEYQCPLCAPIVLKNSPVEAEGVR